MHTLFIAALNEKFPNQFTVESAENDSVIRFPAKSPEFGDVEIYEEYPGAYIVSVGKFTHSHFDYYEGSEEEQIKEAAEIIIDFLEELFADRVICFGSHIGGGFYVKRNSEDDEITDDGYKIPFETSDSFVWSGIYKRAN